MQILKKCGVKTRVLYQEMTLRPDSHHTLTLTAARVFTPAAHAQALADPCSAFGNDLSATEKKM